MRHLEFATQKLSPSTECDDCQLKSVYCNISKSCDFFWFYICNVVLIIISSTKTGKWRTFCGGLFLASFPVNYIWQIKLTIFFNLWAVRFASSTLNINWSHICSRENVASRCYCCCNVWRTVMHKKMCKVLQKRSLQMHTKYGWKNEY